jgi:hypothetical protein
MLARPVVNDKVVREGDAGSGEVTCVEGEHFPPIRSRKGAHDEWFTARRREGDVL